MFDTTKPAVTAPAPNRWTQLTLGVICMMLIANLQYSWTLFVKPMNQANGWTIAEIQVAFSIFIALETWFTPAAGMLVDFFGPRVGPKISMAIGGVLVAIAWVINAYATNLEMLYVGAAVSGLGAGGIYATCVGSAVKWFPDRRGLAVGLTAAGFGAGAALTVIPIKAMIASSGYAATFFWFGIGQGVALFVFAWFLRQPEPGQVVASGSTKVKQSLINCKPKQMVKTPIFWLLYFMFILVSASGLMAAAQLALIATDLKLSDTVLFLGATTLSVALVVDNVMNGVARPFFGWVSDQIGRETTMIIAFGMGGCAYLLLGYSGANPWLFVLCAGLIFFTWGEIFSLFPSTCADVFGTKYATVNASILYTAKGASALLIPFANIIKDATGGWYAVFLTAAAMNFTVVLLVVFVMPGLRNRHQIMATRVEPLTAAV